MANYYARAYWNKRNQLWMLEKIWHEDNKVVSRHLIKGKKDWPHRRHCVIIFKIPNHWLLEINKPCKSMKELLANKMLRLQVYLGIVGISSAPRLNCRGYQK
jgi:hypothetical protein